MTQIIVVDTETTGLCPYRNEPLSIAMLAIDDNLQAKDSGITVRIKAIKPDISPKALQINGLNPEEGDDRETAWGQLVAYIRQHNTAPEKLVLLGHNVKFDIDMMQYNIPAMYSAWFKNTFDHAYLCTLVLSRQYFIRLGLKRKCNLNSMCEYFGIKGAEHEAFSDVLRSLELYRKLTGTEGQLL